MQRILEQIPSRFGSQEAKLDTVRDLGLVRFFDFTAPAANNEPNLASVQIKTDLSKVEPAGAILRVVRMSNVGRDVEATNEAIRGIEAMNKVVHPSAPEMA